MKRPSGFDRGPEPERRAPRPAPVDAERPNPAAPPEAAQPRLSRARGVLRRGQAAPEVAPESVSEPASESASEPHAARPAPAQGRPADLAETADFSATIDLSDSLVGGEERERSATERDDLDGLPALGAGEAPPRRSRAPGRGLGGRFRRGGGRAGAGRAATQGGAAGTAETGSADAQDTDVIDPDARPTDVIEPGSGAPDVAGLPSLDPGDEHEAAGDDPGAIVPGGAGVRSRLARREKPLPSPEARARAELRRARRERRKRERTERRRFGTHLRRRRRPWLIGLAAVAGLALFVGIGVLTPIMGVREIQVAGTERVDEAAIQEALAPQLGTPLALVEDGQVREALSGFTLIQEYAVERVPPHTLVVRVAERRPVLAVEADGGFALLDQAGIRIETGEARPEGFPLATGKAAEVGHPAFVAVAAALQQMPPDLLAGFNQVTASTGEDIRFTVNGGPDVVWGGPDDSGVKSVILASMRTALANRAVTVIDVSSTESPVFTEQE
ncbi:FtsQ-type POTRA domain-containing protein [Leucobacter sp. M11]|uniref:FtsQ-type POTRA domain-containing protein n=1 Tax=Leucobacter sp. M11 TaxID=2993565 RepID=UPI002D7EFF85|nr:FtsQ-type POTRA domain-containing protein [Leucobacter sp. M11]MEB4616580.1 FtsQ-type POTRA domain-containing protein [Leucobacter sp. M11]